MQSSATHFEFKPFNVARWVIWGLFAIILLLAPKAFSSNFSVSMLTQMGAVMIVCLSYNMLLGQGGMLSFGHAVYTGLGAYIAMHTLNAAASGVLPVPVSLIPLVGGIGGMFFAVLFGYVTTRKSGTTFAMITLGISELVFAMSLMFSGFFGGEAGISGNRVVGTPFLGITFGPPIQVYYLTAAYTFVCVALMYAFTRTPLGRILNAVRDNPERVEFIGYNTQQVRYVAFIIAGFFAGIAGGIGALNFEIVTAENVGAARSGAYLLFTFLGGATFFFGPIIGNIAGFGICIAIRIYQSMVAVSGTRVLIHGDVRTRRHLEFDHDESSFGCFWSLAPYLGRLYRTRINSAVGIGRRCRHRRDGLSLATQ